METSSNYRTIHSQFKLNGVSYDSETLKSVAYDFVKEGEPHERQIGKFLGDWLDDREVIEVQTSGSTGTPTTVLLQKQHMANSARATGTFFRLQPGDTALLCLPTAYIAGKMMLVRALVLGLELDVVQATKYPLEAVQRTYDFCAMVPLQAVNSLTHIEQVKTLIIGGAPLSMGLKQQLAQSTTQVYETYGMTETCTHVALRECTTNSTSSEANFLALPQVTFATDDRGCLVITAPMIATGPVVTNDMIRLVSPTEFQWLGRFDHVINSGGIKLFPEQIEAKLASAIPHPFFVAPLADEELGQKLVLVIEGDIDLPRFTRTLKATSILERFEFPKEIHAIPEFLKTETGKIRRRATLELLNR